VQSLQHAVDLGKQPRVPRLTLSFTLHRYADGSGLNREPVAFGARLVYGGENFRLVGGMMNDKHLPSNDKVL
jgi:hypothetical protein